MWRSHGGGGRLLSDSAAVIEWVQQSGCMRLNAPGCAAWLHAPERTWLLSMGACTCLHLRSLVCWPHPTTAAVLSAAAGGP